MNNEAILAKLVELGYVQLVRKLDSGASLYQSKEGLIFGSTGFDCLMTHNFVIVLDALISECGKRGHPIVIFDSMEIYQDKYMRGTVFESDYSRQSVAEAFMKVTGISEVSDE